MCVCIYFGEQGSREVAQIFESGISIKQKEPLLFDKAFSYVFGSELLHSLSLQFQTKHVYMAGDFTVWGEPGQPHRALLWGCRKQQELEQWGAG